MRQSLPLLICLALASCTSAPPEAELHDHDRVTFLRANRGHEIVVQKGDRTARVRLVGVYAFDPKVRRNTEISSLADMAVAAWNERFAGKELELILERAQPDPRGRYLGYLQAGAQDVAETMLREGLLALYTEFPFRREAEYKAAEEVARGAVRGIWASEVVVERLRALRSTWSAVRAREFGSRPADPFLATKDTP